MKLMLGIIAILMVAVTNIGCNRSRKYEINDTAPVTTYNVIFVDNVNNNDQQEIIDAVAIIFSGFLADYQPVINNTVNNSTVYNINITLDQVQIVIGNNNSVLTWSGDLNECPELYEALCKCLLGDDHPDKPKWKNRGKQLSDDCKKNRDDD